MLEIKNDHDTKALFHSFVNDKQSPEFTLLFIETAFDALAEDKGDLEFKGRTLRVGDLGASEVRGLCKLSEKFFRREVNLPVNGKLLCDIEKVKGNERYIHIDFESIDNTERLNKIKELLFLNQKPEVAKGARTDLQNTLCDEIKENASTIKRMRRMEKVKRWIILTAMWVGIIVTIAGFFWLALSGYMGGGIALFVAGTLASVGIATAGIERIKLKVKRAQWIQDARMWAYELLKDKKEFQSFCEERELDPESVTVTELLLSRR